ncbi:RNA-directed DNA polymerase, eukaryota [Tanacetum coccineum]
MVIDKGEGNVDDINKIMNVVKSIQELQKLQSMEAAQKAKIKWTIEGDENSKYYHGILNKKRSHLSIRGVLVNGIWIDTPALVKNEFLSHFKNRFEKPQEARLKLNMDFPCNLTSIQQADMETEVTKEYIKRAVWDCGVDKSLGPDGFTFGFYRHFWKLIENDVVDAVKYFFQHVFIPNGCNSSFISLIPKTIDAKMVKDFRPISLIGSLYKIIAKILANRLVVVLGDIVNEIQSAFVVDRQILDGPFILNELFQWCKSKKKHSLIFKVDFEKAYDSVRWDYLDDVLKKFGFGDRWCGWIQGCIRSSWGSVIVNGSMFKSIALGPSMQISHTFYADDAVFVEQWSDSNINTIVHVLDCFYRASGLRINISKSKIMGISVDEEKVDEAALKIGCVTFKAPFSYLGSKVGGLMSRIQSWHEIVDYMVMRLSKWKMKTLSIGGRLTLLKSVLGSMPIYHMSIYKVPMKVLPRMESIRCHFLRGVDLCGKKSIWVKWKNVLVSKEKGGLGVSSLYVLNRAVMFKWIWLFITQSSSLWARVIKAIHGDDGKIAFWEDVWRDNVAFKHRYPRLYALESCKSIDVAIKLAHITMDYSFRLAPRGGVEQSQFVDLMIKVEGVSLVNMNDRWVWSLEGSGDFSVASVRKLIDDKRLPEVSSKTR